MIRAPKRYLHFAHCPPSHRCGGGGHFTTTPAICQTILEILDPKTAFDGAGHELSEYFVELYQKITNDVTDQANVRCFTICRCWIRRAKYPYEVETRLTGRPGSCLECFLPNPLLARVNLTQSEVTSSKRSSCKF